MTTAFRPWVVSLASMVALTAVTGCGTVQPSPSAAVTSSATGTPVEPTSTIAPSVTPTADASIVLAGSGVAGKRFGTAEEEVVTVLHDRLGEPGETFEGVLCELNPDSPWARTLSYGGLWVQFTAKDQSKSSPRSLDAWGFILEQPFESPLEMADGVPLTLSFAELKAKYPAGKLETLPLGEDETRIFTLPSGIRFLGTESKPDMVSAGTMALCD